MKLTQIFLIILFFTLYFKAFPKNLDSLEKHLSQTGSVKEIEILLELSEAYRNINPDKSIKYASDALRISKDNNLVSFESNSAYSLGFSYYLKNDYLNAINYLEMAVTLRTKIDDKPGLASALNRLGNTYQLKGDYVKALELYNEALTLNEDIKDKQETARTLTNIGSIYRIHGIFDKAIDYHLKALKYYEEGGYKDGMAWIYLNIARLFNEMGEYTKALGNTQRSLDLYTQISDKTGITLCLSEMSLISYKTGDLKNALDYRRKVLQINEETNNQNAIANSIAEIGKIYFDMGDYKNTLTCLNNSIKIKSSLKDNSGLASIYRYIGNSYLNLSDYTKANEYLKKSLLISDQQSLRNEMKETYQALTLLSIKNNNYRDAYYYQNLYAVLKDSLNIKNITKLELQYEFDKKQQQMEFERKQKEAIQKAEIQKQKIIKNSFIGGFILMVLLAFFIFKNYRQKKKSNIELQLKNNEILKQKKEIETQRDEIETRKNIAEQQRDQIIHQNKVITESIKYAQRIQSAVFPQVEEFNNVFADHFILFKPRDIVSGDFYWFSKKNEKIILAVCDCTGHGIPAAFMSMLGIAYLNEVVNKSGIIEAGDILNSLRNNVIDALHQTGDYRESKDGMDMALVIINTKTNEIQYAGANSPLYFVSENNLIEYKPDRMPIGIHMRGDSASFINNTFSYQKGDSIYMFTDGYVDQFGGPEGVKFKYQPFRDLLLKVADKTMSVQKEIIEDAFNNWKNRHSQLDDVLVVGIKLA